MDKLLTLAEAAVQLGVSQSRISQMIKEGRLKAERLGDKEQFVRIRESEVARCEAGRKIPTALLS